MEGLRVAGEAGLEYVLTGVELWGTSLAAVPQAALEQAQRAARAGVGLDTVLRRYLAGHAVLEDFVMWELEREDRLLDTGAPRAVLQAVAALTDRLIRAVSGAYGQEAERVGTGHAGVALAVSRERARASVRTGVDGPPSRGERTLVTTGPRERILAAMVEVVAERGFARTTVRSVSERAGVSTRTFYEEFASVRECFIALWIFLTWSEPLTKAKPSERSSPGARRSRECLAHLADHPNSSNSEIAAAIGIAHRSQISKLLSDLQSEGLVVKDAGDRPGTPNAWRLSLAGEARARSLGARDEPGVDRFT